MSKAIQQTEHSEKPILFSGSMVRAILEGRKTQTRRVLLPQPGERTVKVEPRRGTRHKLIAFIWRSGAVELTPYRWKYDVGHRLWVRETWLYADHCPPPDTYAPSDIHYRASATEADLEWLSEEGFKWRPSIFMPRWASRITLEITGVKVERLQEISEEDAIAEGAGWLDFGLNNYSQRQPGWTFAQSGDIRPSDCFLSAKNAFANGWNKLNSKRGYSFESSPYVWAITFKRLAQ